MEHVAVVKVPLGAAESWGRGVEEAHGPGFELALLDRSSGEVTEFVVARIFRHRGQDSIHPVFGTFEHLQDGAVEVKQDSRDFVESVA